MVVKEILNELKGQYVDYEIYELYNKTNKKPFHTDNLWRNYSEENTLNEIWQYVLNNENVLFYELADEEEYNNSILANTCEKADFSEWYDNKNAKVLLIAVDTDTITD